METAGIGIIGYGGFASFCRQAWAELEDVRVVAAADSDPSRNPGDLRFYADWRELVRDPEVSIVVVSTPPSTHAEMGLEAVHEGRHVLLEKPPATSFQELDALLCALRDGGPVIAVDYMLRYNPLVLALKSIAETGCLGRLQHVSVVNYAADGNLPPEHWFWDRKVSGGILVEHAVHFFDMVAYVWQTPPVRVTAHTVCRQKGMEDKVVATVQHADGLLATHFHHFFRPSWFERQSFRFAFDAGEVDIEGWIPLTARIRAAVDAARKEQLLEILPQAQVVSASPAAPELRAAGVQYSAGELIEVSSSVAGPKSDVYAACLRGAMRDLVDSLRSGGRPVIALERVADSVRIACAATASAESGQAVQI
ncbi:MAG: hypothetical protein KatS3mg024_0013 [Armatimonadota bacterium]|nr:MAG: hypothetical protein KatS3mg024_0013 [Armatimonadota bacterium]